MSCKLCFKERGGGGVKNVNTLKSYALFFCLNILQMLLTELFWRAFKEPWSYEGKAIPDIVSASKPIRGSSISNTQFALFKCKVCFYIWSEL